jgi:hypothetical protein
MPRFFNVAGPCQPGDHYLLPAQARLADLQTLIDTKQFFVIHAARQSGKTTLLLDLVRTLNEGGRYAALYLSCERAQGLDDSAAGVPALLEALERELRWHPLLKEQDLGDHAGLDRLSPSSRLLEAFSRLAQASPRPLVVLMDEADCLGGATLIGVLRQLRDGYVNRSRAPFIHSLALVGMRNIRDFKASVRPDAQTLGSASPFNIVKESLTLRNFTRDEVATLYAQHTAETGQVFPPDVVDLVHAQTQGQPWLVNAIACQIVERELRRDPTLPITVATAQAAIQALILRRDTHIDSLLERLKEDRVRRVVEPVILGAEHALDMLSDDVRYCLDLGLLQSDKGTLSAACPIYAEVICRALSWSSQAALPTTLEHRWMTEDALDLDGLLRAFQQFWRENAEAWTGRYDYAEAAPHLILMAFLQRVLNGGGYIAREFATGRKRLDLDVQYGGKHHPIELKLWYGPKARGDGEQQLADYCRSLGTGDGWLLLFDRRPGRSWEERIFWDTVERDGVRLRVIGC